MSVDELAQAHPGVDRALLTKWERIFNLCFDRNRSKKVDYGDFYLITRKARDIYGAESVQFGFTKDSLATLWDGLCTLAGKTASPEKGFTDKQITIDDFINVMHKMAPGNPWLISYQTFLFKLFDVSKDGLIDLAEYTDGLALFGIDNRTAHTAFPTLLSGKDGEKISSECWTRLFNELFFSKDEKAAGNALFGLN